MNLDGPNFQNFNKRIGFLHKSNCLLLMPLEFATNRTPNEHPNIWSIKYKDMHGSALHFLINKLSYVKHHHSLTPSQILHRIGT